MLSMYKDWFGGTEDTRAEFDHSQNPMSYQHQIYFGSAMLLALLMVPFSVYHFLQGNLQLGAVALVVVCVFGTNVIAIKLRGKPLIPPLFTFLPLLIALPVGVHYAGVTILLWTYPAILIASFVLKPRIGTIVTAGLALSVIPPAYFMIEPATFIRASITLAMTVVFSAIYATIVARQQRELYNLAITDTLTGAFNRRHLDKSIENAIARHGRSGAHHSMVLIDIDHFKKINDELGHTVGDVALWRVVNTIRTSTRRVDSLFRYGGEEFILLLPDSQLNQAEMCAQKIRELIENTEIIHGRKLTISCGVAELTAEDNQDSWLARCDKAMYKAKAEGRNRVVLETT